MESMEKSEIALLGLSFKHNTDDLRGSPMVEVARHLWSKGCRLHIYEPSLNVTLLIGANKRAGERKIPNLDALLKDDLSSALGSSGSIVSAPQCVSIDELRPSVTSSHHVLDVNGWPELRGLPSHYKGFCW
ncbi:MAG: GDP-mannose dehydrogenase [Verrucomicrobiales bacterium]|nr:GDP-mannose dehydrogenase [Verrucomicrobiales bacterium]